MTSKQRGLYWFFSLSLKVVSEMNNSNNIKTLYTEKSFSSRRVDWVADNFLCWKHSAALSICKHIQVNCLACCFLYIISLMSEMVDMKGKLYKWPSASQKACFCIMDMKHSKF